MQSQAAKLVKLACYQIPLRWSCSGTFAPERHAKAVSVWCRRAEREAVKAQAHDEASPVEILDLSRPAEEQGGDEDVQIWRMEPEELFSWNGFPDVDVRRLVNKIRGRRRRAD